MIENLVELTESNWEKIENIASHRLKTGITQQTFTIKY